MNKSYISIGNNEVVVSDEKGNLSVRENHPNIEEILKQEDIIKSSLNEVVNKETFKFYNYLEKENHKSLLKIIGIGTAFVLSFIVLAHLYVLGGKYLSGVSIDVLKPSIDLGFRSIAAVLSMGVIIAVVPVIQLIDTIKDIKRTEKEIEYLSVGLDKELEKQNELEKGTVTPSNDYDQTQREPQTINQEEVKSYLENKRNVAQVYAICKNKLSKYYQTGLLREKFKDVFNEDQFQIIEGLLQNQPAELSKGRSKVKK